MSTNASRASVTLPALSQPTLHVSSCRGTICIIQVVGGRVTGDAQGAVWVTPSQASIKRQKDALVTGARSGLRSHPRPEARLCPSGRKASSTLRVDKTHVMWRFSWARHDASRTCTGRGNKTTMATPTTTVTGPFSPAESSQGGQDGQCSREASPTNVAPVMCSGNKALGGW